MKKKFNVIARNPKGVTKQSHIKSSFRLQQFFMITVILLFCYIPFLGAAENVVADDFVKANTAYRDGKYQEAILGYEGILQGRTESGAVFFNLGNSYFKNKQLGQAIVNYERAQRLIPRDSDLEINYKFALTAVGPRVEPAQNFFVKIYSGHVRSYTVNEMFLILVVIFMLLGAVHLSGLYWKWTASRVVMGVLMVLLLIFVIGLVLKVSGEKDASVVIKSTPARFEPSDKATVYFELPEGQKVRSQMVEGDWLKIQRPDGKTGWVPLVTVEKI